TRSAPMAIISRLAGAVTALALGTGGALAADIVPVVPAAPPAVVVPAPAGFDFGGFYAGATGGFQTGIPPRFYAGGQAGFNIQRNRYVFGVQTNAGAFVGGISALTFGVDGRAGVVLGQRILAYGVGGIGFTPGPGFTYWSAG